MLRHAPKCHSFLTFRVQSHFNSRRFIEMSCFLFSKCWTSNIATVTCFVCPLRRASSSRFVPSIPSCRISVPLSTVDISCSTVSRIHHTHSFNHSINMVTSFSQSSRVVTHDDCFCRPHQLTSCGAVRQVSYGSAVMHYLPHE